MRDRERTRRAAALLSALSLVGGAWACGGNGAGDDTERPAAVLDEQDVAVARISEMRSGVVVTGTLQPAWMASVKAQVPGTIGALRADRGVAVRRGQVLATIVAEGIRGQAAGARASVAAAEANLAVAAQRLESARMLRQAGALSEIDYKAAQAGYRAAEAALAAARAGAAGAVEAADRANVTSPIDGVVSARSVEIGEAVNPGQELFRVVRSDFLELSGRVSVEAASGIRPGQPVLFTISGGLGRELRGEVARVEPMADPDTRQVGVYLRLRNPGGLIGGQFATGRVIGQRVERAIVVPESAVRGSGADAHVLVIAGDSVVRRPVEVGIASEEEGTVAVRSGLQEGERVITTASILLEDGARVQVGGGGGAPVRPGRGD